MIAKQHRFSGRTSLRYVYTKGQTVRGSLLSIKYVENSRQPGYRLAVVISKKVSKSAVKRNRIRRRIYEVVRHHETEIVQPFDIVMTIFNEAIADLPADRLEKSLLKLLGQTGVLGGSKQPTSPEK